METNIFKGFFLQEKIFNEIKKHVSELMLKHKSTPGIAFIGFSSMPLNKYNLPYHVQMAQAAGFNVHSEILTDETSEKELVNLIEKLNSNKNIHAIVLMQPLPAHINPIKIINKIDPNKEIEGFHPQNMLSTLIPDLETEKYPMCLPAALLEIFSEIGVQFTKDQEWVFLLDDEFISNPLTTMVVKCAASKAVPKDCPVTFINKNSAKLLETCKRADILVIVSKTIEYIKPEWLKSGVCIIDIYSNLVKEVPSSKNPEKLVPVIRGGVNVDSVKNIASLVLPIPGGLMTVVLPVLLRNAMIAFRNSMNN